MLLDIPIFIKIEHCQHLTLVGLYLQLPENRYSEIQHRIYALIPQKYKQSCPEFSK